MTSGLLTKLMLLAADGSTSGFSFDELAQRFRAGKGGMYPIALCAVVALAIIWTGLWFYAASAAEATLAAATALNPYIGYDRAAEIVNEAGSSGRMLREVAYEKGVDEQTYNKAMDLRAMARGNT